MSSSLLAATFAAGFLYVLSPGPAVLALFALTAADGRRAGARFVTGHLVGDIVWGSAALASIIGVSLIGALVFEALGFLCGAYLIWLGAKAVWRGGGGASEPIGLRRPLATGVLFGLTNPKAYPVAAAMFTALTAGFASQLTFADAPALLASALAGFLAADVVLVFCAGLPAARRLFALHGDAITRVVGVLFILFGVKSAADAALSFARRA